MLTRSEFTALYLNDKYDEVTSYLSELPEWGVSKKQDNAILLALTHFIDSLPNEDQVNANAVDKFIFPLRLVEAMEIIEEDCFSKETIGKIDIYNTLEYGVSCKDILTRDILIMMEQGRHNTIHQVINTYGQAKYYLKLADAIVAIGDVVNSWTNDGILSDTITQLRNVEDLLINILEGIDDIDIVLAMEDTSVEQLYETIYGLDSTVMDTALLKAINEENLSYIEAVCSLDSENDSYDEESESSFMNKYAIGIYLKYKHNTTMLSQFDMYLYEKFV